MGAIVNDQWEDFILRAHFHSSRGLGWVKCWRNGTLMVDTITPDPTLFPIRVTKPGGYVKFGYYRDVGIATATVYHDNFRACRLQTLSGPKT
jgi:hypothetical protein